MGAGHGHRLHYHGHSIVHRLPGEVKIVGLLAFVLAVVAVPRSQYWAYAVDALLVVAVVVASRVPPAYVARRMVVEVPFVVFALVLPFVAQGPRVEVLGLAVSESGLHAGATMLCKATLGVAAALVLAATTEPREVLTGLEGKIPGPLLQIMTMMVRYLDVTTDQMRRMAVARAARGFESRNVRHWPVLASSAGALFLRSYERGERVHLAMVSRGWTGRMPPMSDRRSSPREWCLALLPALVAAVTAWAAWSMR